MDKTELTIKEAAAQLYESDRLLRLWCQQGRFPNAHLVERPREDYWLMRARDVMIFVKPRPGPVPKQATATPPTTKSEIQRADKTAQKLN